MIREALDRMALGERAVLAGVEVERVSLFGFKLWGTEVFSRGDAAALLIGAPTWSEMTAGAVPVFAGRGAEAAREPWELEVAGSSPAAQTVGGPGRHDPGRDQTLVMTGTSARPSPPSAVRASVDGGAAAGEREQERLRAGAPETQARIEVLRRQHGRALRVTGRAKAKRARWTGQDAWLVVSYPKEARGT